MPKEFLEMRNVVKVYGGIKALNNVDLVLKKGELLCLLGENGAGKSTLMKILSGVVQPTSGEIYFKGEKLEIKNPDQAHKAGFSTVYQEMVQLPDMSISENIFVGRYPKKKSGLIDFRRLRSMTLELMDRLDIHFDPDLRIRSLSIAQRQLVEIIKAVSLDAEVLILDEPTSSLTTEETAILFRIINDLKQKGISIIYISHRLEDVFAIGDRAMVLRDGANSGEGMVKDLSRDQIIKMMVGHSLDQQFPPRTHAPGEEIFRAEHICNERVKDATFQLKRGEILGFGGLVGAGRSELMRAVMGIDKASGTVWLNGEKVNNTTPYSSIKNGFAAVPEDRKDEGLVLKLSIGRNVELSSLKQFIGSIGLLDAKKERTIVNEYIDKLSIKTYGPGQIAGDLSGGNQQKVVLARCLATKPQVLILDEPTRGIDVGAKYEIYEIMNRLVEQGVSIIMISSELPELLSMSDRIIVMREGYITGELDYTEATEESVMNLATKEIAVR